MDGHWELFRLDNNSHSGTFGLSFARRGRGSDEAKLVRQVQYSTDSPPSSLSLLCFFPFFHSRDDAIRPIPPPPCTTISLFHQL